MSKRSRLLIFISIALVTFIIWFADGYLQWVNSDTACEAFARLQDINFPQAIVSSHFYHSRITASILSYIPFHTVNYLYRELTGDPVNALFISQGVMTGTIFTLLVLISAAYISICAATVSAAYLISAIVMLMLTMAVPILSLNAPLSLGLRFGHQSVMINYIGTMVIALFALFPYWRFLFSGNWDDWYNDVKRRCLFYVIIIAAVLSSTGTMIWLGTFAALFSFRSVTCCIRRKSAKEDSIISCLRELLMDTKSHPLLFIMVLCAVGTLAESTTYRASKAFFEIDVIEYIAIYASFMVGSGFIWCVIGVYALFICFLAWSARKRTISTQLLVLYRIFPWLVVGNLFFIFFIGLPRVPYRFGGYNLGPDSVFPATWSMVLWLCAVISCFWKGNKLTWLAPFLVFTMFTNSLNYFTFFGYEKREKQRRILSNLYREDMVLPNDITLPIPVENVAFSKAELHMYTIPMLRSVGVVSGKRKMAVVSQDVYGSWQESLANNGTPAALRSDYLEIEAGQKIMFNSGDLPGWAGWSYREPWGTWSDGPVALVLLQLSRTPESDLEVLIEGNAFVADRHPTQEVYIFVNGQYVKRLRYDEESRGGVREIDIPRALAVGNNDALLMRFCFKNPKSPAELGLSADRRRLGLGIVSLELRNHYGEQKMS
jgi:hypothetical protein